MRLLSIPRSQALASPFTGLLLSILFGCQGISPMPTSAKALQHGTMIVVLNPGSISFGNQTVNTTASQTLTVHNVGTSKVRVQQVVLSGSSDFRISKWSGGSTIPPGGSASVLVSFTPVKAGAVNATLTLHTDYSSNTNSAVSLSGTGESGGGGGGGGVTVSVSPTSASLVPSQNSQFTATVSGASSTAVTWSVNNVVGGNSNTGTVSSAGLYTAPACGAQSSVQVTATSVSDSSASSSAVVSLAQSGGGPNQYYVATDGSDSNDGSACHPWATIQHAASTVGPGSIVNVEPGTYAGPISTSTSGTSASRIRYISSPQFGAVIQCTSSCDMVWTQSGNYVDVLGFTLTSTEPATRIGFEWTGSNGLIQGNKVHDIQCSGCVGNGGAGINVDNGSEYTIADSNIVYNIDFSGKGNADSLYVHGIYVHTYYNVISNNLVYRCAGWGVEQGHEVSNSTIVNNLVFGCGGGVMIGTGGSSGTSNNNVINNNILVYNGPGYDGHGYGIDAIQNYGSTNTISNNLMYANQPSNTSSALNGSATITGSITNLDPASGKLFTNWQSDGSGNYQLKSGSAAIDAGTSMDGTAFDIEGGKRPAGGLWDIGPYEFSTTAAAWPWD